MFSHCRCTVLERPAAVLRAALFVGWLMKTFETIFGTALMVLAAVCLWFDRIDLATFDLALAAAHFARMAAVK